MTSYFSSSSKKHFLHVLSQLTGSFSDCRGGAGADPAWHRSGSGMEKLNSIYDFVSCGKYLVDEGYVHERQLATVAHSAGCLVVGAAINMCPHLFQAAILKVWYRTRSLLIR